jgi:hypothetical protein
MVGPHTQRPLFFKSEGSAAGSAKNDEIIIELNPEKQAMYSVKGCTSSAPPFIEKPAITAPVFKLCTLFPTFVTLLIWNDGI